jgi:hypothetical protein
MVLGALLALAYETERRMEKDRSRRKEALWEGVVLVVVWWWWRHSD